MTLPATILYPEAFLRNRPAGFDGVFDWDCVIAWEREFDPASKIKPMDHDAVIERNGHVLKFETKELGKPVGRAQMRALRVETWPRANGETRVLIAWGFKTKIGQGQSMQWQHIGMYGKTSTVRNCTISDIRGFYLAWRLCAERRDMRGLIDAYHVAKTAWRPSRALSPQRLDQGDLFQSLGEAATAVLASLRAKRDKEPGR